METKDKIDAEIEHALDSLAKLNPDSPEYGAAANNLKILCEARSKKPWRLVEPDVIVSVAANLVGILMILHYERFNVISTKALSMIWRR